jgi:hypothetical protein
MKKLIKISACLVVIALIYPLTTLAEESTNGQITAKVSTMGLGVEYNHPINSVLSVGFGINKFSKSKLLTKSNIDYNGDIDFKSASIIANYHPWSNGFRLRAGAYYNNNKINLTANSSTGDLTIGGTAFTGADITLNGNLSFQKFAPYVGIGYGSEPFGDNNLSFDLDIGVMRSPVRAQLNGTCTVGVGAATVCNTFNTELVNEQRALTKDTDDLDLYPVISLGLLYRF